MSSWREHRLHVLTELGELKSAQLRHDADTKEIMSHLSDIKADMKGFKTSQKWEIRIMSTLWGLIIMGVNAIIGNHAK